MKPHARYVQCNNCRKTSLITGNTSGNLVTAYGGGTGFGGLGVACWPLVPKFAGSGIQAKLLPDIFLAHISTFRC